MVYAEVGYKAISLSKYVFVSKRPKWVFANNMYPGLNSRLKRDEQPPQK